MRLRISGGDSISLSGARPDITNKRIGMKRCVSAKFGLNEIGKYNLNQISFGKKQENEQIDTVLMMKDITKPSIQTVKINDGQRARSPPLITLTNVTVDTSKAKSNSDVIRKCLIELGWQECSKGGLGCDIIWQSCAASHEGRDSINSTPNNGSSLALNETSSTTRINKFPCMNQLLRKGPLTQSLNAMRMLFNSDYDFYPKTWFLPEQLKEFADECKYMHDRYYKTKKPQTIFIVKPNDGSQGEGIYLINNVDEYLRRAGIEQQQRTSTRAHPNYKMHIVQEYIHNPYLIDGLKSDLRIYVVILSIKPLQIYIYDEGLVR